MTDYEKLLAKIGEQTVYFENTFENAKIKAVPATGFFIKFPGKPEYKADHSNSIVAEGLREAKEISAKEYNS